MGNRLQDKICVITGASSGMGAEAARAFAREGASVVIAARREDKGQAVADEIKAAGGEALFVRTDVLELDDIENLVNTTIDTYGRIDVALGNAGTGNFFDIHNMDIEHDFDWTMNLFCRANWYFSKLVLPYMMEQHKGDIIFTLSTAALEGVPRGSVYSGAKAALRNLCKAIAMAYGQYDIRCNCILPGLITTELSIPGGAMEKRQLPYIPMHRPGTCEEVANTLIFLASDEARYVTGADIIIDGGMACGLLRSGQDPEQAGEGTTNKA